MLVLRPPLEPDDDGGRGPIFRESGLEPSSVAWSSSSGTVVSSSARMLSSGSWLSSSSESSAERCGGVRITEPMLVTCWGLFEGEPTLYGNAVLILELLRDEGGFTEVGGFPLETARLASDDGDLIEPGPSVRDLE